MLLCAGEYAGGHFRPCGRPTVCCRADPEQPALIAGLDRLAGQDAVSARGGGPAVSASDFMRRRRPSLCLCHPTLPCSQSRTHSAVSSVRRQPRTLAPTHARRRGACCVLRRHTKLPTRTGDTGQRDKVRAPPGPCWPLLAGLHASRRRRCTTSTWSSQGAACFSAAAFGRAQRGGCSAEQRTNAARHLERLARRGARLLLRRVGLRAMPALTARAW